MKRYVFSLGKLHLILDLLYIRFGNIISRLTNILSVVVLPCPHENRKAPETKLFLHDFSTEMPEIAPKSVRFCSFH